MGKISTPLTQSLFVGRNNGTTSFRNLMYTSPYSNKKRRVFVFLFFFVFNSVWSDEYPRYGSLYRRKGIKDQRQIPKSWVKGNPYVSCKLFLGASRIILE